MTTRNLDALFKPKRVALIGASGRERSVGAVLAANLLDGAFTGSVDWVHPRLERLRDRPVYATVKDLPETPDLAVIATPPETVPGLVADLAARGTRGAVIITAGFGELGAAASERLQQQILDAARPSVMRIIGPNCLGIMAAESGLNASFAHLPLRPGRLALVTQTGAVMSAVLDWAAPREIGFSHLISLGDMADVDFGDMLDYLALDRETGAILLYMESVTSPRKFLSAARAASRQKPVIVVKAGRYAVLTAKAETHTAALLRADAVFGAALRRAGAVRVETLEDLFDAAAILSAGRRPTHHKLTIVSNSSGLALLAADALQAQLGELAVLPEPLRQQLDAVLPATWSGRNPVDLVGDADGARHQAALDILLADPATANVLVLNSPTGVVDSLHTARTVAETATAHPRATVLTSWVGAHTAAEARRWLSTHGLSSYAGPAQAVTAFMHLVHYREVQTEVLETPPSLPDVFSPDVVAARRVIDTARSEQRTWLSTTQCAALLAAYQVPLVSEQVAESPEAAAWIAAALGQPVAVKLISPDVRHKSEVGGVLLNLDGAEVVRAATAALRDRLRLEQPALRISGFLVQPMVNAQHGLELIAGIGVDPLFGPVILFGHGGTATEVIADTAVALPPLNLQLARRLIDRTRIARLLAAHPGRQALDRDALALILVKLSQLIVDLPQIRELDINPLLLSPSGVVALDARCRLYAAPQVARLSIRPYPLELEERLDLVDGRQLLLRPIRPEDEPMLQAAFDLLTPEEVHLRFHMFMRNLPHSFAARLTQIDYDREMALALTEHGAPGKAAIHGVVRLVVDPDEVQAEFAIIVGQSVRGQGMGRRLMRRILDYARSRGIQAVVGDVLDYNTAMLELSRSLGFTLSRRPDEKGVVRVIYRITPESPP
jgi:acetyltransferase